jgi:ParB-like chromosome segregation protein Spo0J
MKEEYIDANQLIIIGLDTDDGPEHPLYDKRILLDVEESFVRNVMVLGVQQSVLVREQGGKLLVVAGRSRVRAARAATGLSEEAGGRGTKVPVRRVIGDDTRLNAIMITENEIRKGDTVLTKAFKAAAHLDRCGDVQEVAVVFGRSITQVRNWLRLCEAHPKVLEAIRDGKISASAGIEIAHKDFGDQLGLLEKLLKAAEAKPVSEAAAKKERQSSGSTSNQAGVTRTWVRRALKTEAAHSLGDEDREVLKWFAYGEAEEHSWIATFALEAGIELDQ